MNSPTSHFLSFLCVKKAEFFCNQILFHAAPAWDLWFTILVFLLRSKHRRLTLQSRYFIWKGLNAVNQNKTWAQGRETGPQERTQVVKCQYCLGKGKGRCVSLDRRLQHRQPGTARALFRCWVFPGWGHGTRMSLEDEVGGETARKLTTR